jgi:hypothetical protein
MRLFSCLAVRYEDRLGRMFLPSGGPAGTGHARKEPQAVAVCIHMHRSIASTVVGSDVILRRIFVETAVYPLLPVPAGMVTGSIPTG